MDPRNILIITENYNNTVQYVLNAVETEDKIKIHSTLKESLESLKNGTFDAIFTELNLPDSSGINTLINIYTMASKSPIIVLLEKNDDDIELDALRYGADDILYVNNLNSVMFEKSLTHAIERSSFKRKIAVEENKLRKIINNGKDAIIVTDKTGNILFNNTPAEIMFGRPILSEKIDLPIPDSEHNNCRFNNGKEDIDLEINAVSMEWEDTDAVLLNIRDVTKKKKIEEELTFSTSTLKTIFDTIDSGLILADYDSYKILNVNVRTEEILGIKKDGLLGKSFYEFISLFSDYNGAVFNEVNKIESVIKKNGNIDMPVFIITAVMNLKDKKYILINISDISEQKYYNSLLEKNLKYEKFLSKISSRFYEQEDPYDILSGFLEELGTLTGFDQIMFSTFEEADDKKHEMEWHNKSLINTAVEFDAGILKKNMDKNEPLIIDYDIGENTMYLKNGGPKLFSSIFFPVINENVSSGFLCINNFSKNKKEFDHIEINLFITLAQFISMGIERLNKETKIKENLVLMNIMIHTIPEPVFYKDENGKYLGCNDIFAERIFGLPEEEIIGKSLVDLYNDVDLPAGTVEEIHRKDIELIQNKKSVVDEISMKNMDGILRDYIIYRTSFCDLDNQPAGLVGVMIDITEKNRKEAEKEEIEKHLIESEKMSEIGQLSAGIAHEFNNILAIIKSSVQLMNMKNSMKQLAIPDEVLSEFKSIDDNVKKASDIVSNLMKLAKPIELRFDLFLITEIIDEVLKMQKKQFEIENITVEKDYEDVPKIYVDRGQMYQVFLNLSINARHAMKKNGKGVLTVTTRKTDGKVVIYFKDTGIGIRDEIKDKIFQPFYTTKGVHSKENSEIKGTGLGLSVSRSILLGHNGSIEVESEEGKGSTFIIKLPLKSPQNLNKSIIIKNEYVDDTKERRFDRSISIAVVDDEKKIGESIRDALILNGYINVDKYDSGFEFIANYQKSGYDLVLMDYFMPGLNGSDILKRFIEFKDNIKVVIISGNAEDIEFPENNGMVCDIIKKPFEYADLVGRIDKISRIIRSGVIYGKNNNGNRR